MGWGGCTTTSGALGRIGGRIFDMGGSTYLTLGSVPGAERFDLVSSISETDSGLAGGVVVTGSGAGAGVAGAGPGATGGCFALLIGGTAVRTDVLVSVCGFFLPEDIRSVA